MLGVGQPGYHFRRGRQEVRQVGHSAPDSQPFDFGVSLSVSLLVLRLDTGGGGGGNSEDGGDQRRQKDPCCTALSTVRARHAE